MSVVAEKDDAHASEMIRASVRGLRGFDDKDAGPLLERAGINPQTDYLDAIKKLEPIITKEAKDQSLKVEDVLGHYFKDVMVREAIGVGISKGVSGGLFDERV